MLESLWYKQLVSHVVRVRLGLGVSIDGGRVQHDHHDVVFGFHGGRNVKAVPSVLVARGTQRHTIQRDVGHLRMSTSFCT